MTRRDRRVRLRRTLALILGLVGAGIMAVDSLDHIQRGFVGLSAILIVVGGLLSAGLGLLVGLAVGRFLDRRHAGPAGGAPADDPEADRDT